MIDWTPFLLSFKLALISSFILFAFSLPLAYIIARTEFKAKPVIEAVISLPLVLPPSVLGFYMLIFLSPYSFLGKFFEANFDIRLVFNFTGLIIASCVYSLPFMFQPLLAGFKSMPNSLIEASYSLGKSKFKTLIYVAMPNIKPSLLTAFIVSFAHTLGEFGVVLMIGGSIGGETKVASIAIYDAVELLDYDLAHIYSGVMLAISFTVLFVVYYINHKIAKK
ncbi:molybdate ABC transporter permease subunit [Campylobacter fetus]|uniref:molybdate ABC transporter permease subunit n=1 Tax=Campylobacter fetus TaxID=196 RepID=UPI0008189952|nr:molybdate ABC transporter permease subunit [Campylobacter fetus]AVK80687.1 molybdate ABC transporter permease subunit [Campylobacter fetus subsp. testudinum]MPB72744.1 molybdate ABC transporter permease subunit [Campylobacter fetus]MPB76827.1 molybdate ABC transporter permease subunit [Campylobacter fetus]OCR87583.1 molybdenum ABC transporter permease [Campylobacter fetus subsp. testudinum]OCR89494.1 molybdenum ABC transporter permease [Campylobacter fetus subsp. testudinum]